MNETQVATYIFERDHQTAIREAQTRLARALDWYRFTAATPEDREIGRNKIARAQDGVDRAINATLATGRDKLARATQATARRNSIPLATPMPTKAYDASARLVADRRAQFLARQRNIACALDAKDQIAPIITVIKPARSTAFTEATFTPTPITQPKNPYDVIIERDDKWRAEQIAGLEGQGNLFGPNGPTMGYK